jgi:hypothetical protein
MTKERLRDLSGGFGRIILAVELTKTRFYERDKENLQSREKN